MGGLQKFEHRLEQMISGAFARAFRSAVQPVEIAAALQRECDNNAQILSRDRRMVPNDFHVELSPDRPRPARAVRHRARRGARPTSSRSTPSSRATSSPARSRSPSRPPTTSPPAGSGSAARPRPGSPATPRHTQVRRARALARGQRHPPPAAAARPRRRPRHRGRPAHQRPRRQPPARRVRGRTGSGGGGTAIEVRDLGSTNGMLVDGHRITQTARPRRHEVKIGNTTMTVRVIEEDDGCLSSPCS